MDNGEEYTSTDAVLFLGTGWQMQYLYVAATEHKTLLLKIVLVDTCKYNDHDSTQAIRLVNITVNSTKTSPGVKR